MTELCTPSVSYNVLTQKNAVQGNGTFRVVYYQ